MTRQAQFRDVRSHLLPAPQERLVAIRNMHQRFTSQNSDSKVTNITSCQKILRDPVPLCRGMGQTISPQKATTDRRKKLKILALSARNPYMCQDICHAPRPPKAVKQEKQGCRTAMPTSPGNGSTEVPSCTDPISSSP